MSSISTDPVIVIHKVYTDELKHTRMLEGMLTQQSHVVGGMQKILHDQNVVVNDVEVTIKYLVNYAKDLRETVNEQDMTLVDQMRVIGSLMNEVNEKNQTENEKMNSNNLLTPSEVIVIEDSCDMNY